MIQVQVSLNFITLCNNLTVKQITRSTISYRYRRITQRLNRDFWNIDSKIQNSLYVGSYGRGTAVRGFSDLDIIFILPYDLYTRCNKYQSNGQSALLQIVRKSLQVPYPTTDIGGDGQIVFINFKDGIKFEIVPAFLNTDDSFTYANSNNGGSWKITNPKLEINTIQDNNKITNGNLINLCRMVRAWRDTWNVQMGGLLIDTLANNFIMNSPYKDKSFSYYPWMCRDFFQFLSNQNPEQKYWYAVGSNQKVWRKGSFESKAKQCYNLTLEAIEYQYNNMNPFANQIWRKIYGTAYPN